MLLKDSLVKVIELTDDQSYSHAARMIEIKKVCKAALAEIEAAALKAGAAQTAKVPTDGGKAGDTTKEPPKTATAKVTI